MAVAHGSAGYFNLDTSGGNPTDLSTYTREVNFSPEIQMHDTSVFGVGSRTKTTGLKDGKFTVTFVNDPTLQSHLIACYGAQTPGSGTTFTFVWGPQGSTAGSRKITGECILTGFPIDGKVDDVETIQAAFEVTGATSFTTF